MANKDGASATGTLPADKNAPRATPDALPGTGRVVSKSGESASGKIELVNLRGAKFLRVAGKVCFAMSEIASISPMDYEDNTWEAVLDTVAGVFSVPRNEILGRRRPEPIANARHAAWYVARTIGVGGYSELARRSKRDHGAVMHGVKRAQAMIETMPAFKAKVGRVMANFNYAA